NDLGLFDMLGNAHEWCQQTHYRYEAGEDVEDTSDIKDLKRRLLRGGAFSYPARSVRSANRTRHPPALSVALGGFRPARTFPLTGLTALPLNPPKACRHEN